MPAPTPSALATIPKISNFDCRLALEPSCENVGTVLDKTASWLIAISITLFMLMLLVGGIQYLTSAGNEDQTTKAKNTIIWAIVGLIVVLASWAALKFFVERLTGA